MKRLLLFAGLLVISACATTDEEERINPIDDFVKVSELPETDQIRVFHDTPRSEELDEKYVIVATRRELYLLEYAHRCDRDPITNRVRPDVRRDSNHIYAGVDTFRGCMIRALYRITEAQAEELREIVDPRSD